MFTGCKSQSNEEVYISDFYNIHCDSKSAKKLNQTIKNEYKDLVDSLDEAKEEGYTLPYTKVSYDVYTHSNLLSLVIKEEVETEYPRYKVYHFDSKTKKRVSNKKLYKKYKISQKDMKVWAAQAFDQEYANEYYDNVKELRAQTNWFVAFKSGCVLPQRKIECIDSCRHKFWFWNKDGFV